MTARHADFEWPSKIDRAISAGFDPHPDDMRAPAAHLLPGEGVDALAVFAAEVEALRERGAA